MAGDDVGIEGAWLYVLRCRGDRLYCGVCLDLASRWEQHCTGRGAKFTKAFPPQTIAAAWHLAVPLGAVQRYEYQLKRLSRQKKMLLVQRPERISDMLGVPSEEVQTVQQETPQSGN
jgi:predicted GIY-YIG superfamily endonuclease